MRREQDDASLLWDMLDAAQKIQQFVAGRSFHDYSRDEVLQSAVERKLEIIRILVTSCAPACHPERSVAEGRIWPANERDLLFGGQILRLRLRMTECTARTNFFESVS